MDFLFWKFPLVWSHSILCSSCILQVVCMTALEFKYNFWNEFGVGHITLLMLWVWRIHVLLTLFLDTCLWFHVNISDSSSFYSSFWFFNDIHSQNFSFFLAPPLTNLHSSLSFSAIASLNLQPSSRCLFRVYFDTGIRQDSGERSLQRIISHTISSKKEHLRFILEVATQETICFHGVVKYPGKLEWASRHE